ncbi:MAG: 50S ribosomal protein L9 [Holosporaceae bacterium]|jgi:large subunit ribosomal protein L9|nr:50S ribosomal protein L9 [Holosporaceae bacterium]
MPPVFGTIFHLGVIMEQVKVILLQRVARLGSIGDLVSVKPGYARNYLLPKKIALRANQENLKYFEAKRAQIEAANSETRAAALEIAKKMEKLSITLIRQASEKSHLYGSVTNRDVAEALREFGHDVSPGQVNLHTPIKLLGTYDVSVELHPEVAVSLRLVVAKSEEEARQHTGTPSKPEEIASPEEDATSS